MAAPSGLRRPQSTFNNAAAAEQAAVVPPEGGSLQESGDQELFVILDRFQLL